MGKIIGAGSFGTVREAVHASSGRRLAIKTVAKCPKRGPPTPRCGPPAARGGALRAAGRARPLPGRRAAHGSRPFREQAF